MRNHNEHYWESFLILSPILMVAVVIVVVYLLRGTGWV